MVISQSDIKKYVQRLKERDRQEKEASEMLRLNALNYATQKLTEYFLSLPECEVYLFGSITGSRRFGENSGIDIAVQNYKGSRIDLFSDISQILDYPIDLVIMEKCNFAESIKSSGIKIL
jgi:predicted nucleotidyltransferase